MSLIPFIVLTGVILLKKFYYLRLERAWEKQINQCLFGTGPKLIVFPPVVNTQRDKGLWVKGSWTIRLLFH